ncbi:MULTISPECIES: N-acetylglucosamine kinase [Dictyoglomus]|jgi:N-acetylglucosamine kinase-like BadF-type ATPase|uniref:N-acetylglucosamine kinase n=1 Tax=Dictyoglomus TaxID=13 RepID=UPI000CCEB8F2|nr:BadF/BadG/BcrA/BcrD ATPase family protein [Dictyoglomus turgidum]PNV80117.1 MAG: ATPase [Dictyoglomus turgidum]
MYFLGVDGGGTKTIAYLFDEEGNLIFKNTSGPTNILENGEEVFRKNLKELLSSILKDINPKDIKSCFGLPAVGEFREDIKILRNIIKDELKIEPDIIVNDVVIGWAGGNLARDGIHVVAGTGTITYGRKGNKDIRVSGWGSIIGDEGSAYYIGYRTLNEVSRELDGRKRKTDLTKLLFKKLSLKDHLDFIEFIYDPQKDRRSNIASVAKITYEIAKEGDKKALKILKDSAKELAITVTTANKFLKIKKPITVTYSGSVLEKNDIVREEFINILEKEGYKVEPPKLSPVLGAILLAFLSFGNKEKKGKFINKLLEIYKEENKL